MDLDLLETFEILGESSPFVVPFRGVASSSSLISNISFCFGPKEESDSISMTFPLIGGFWFFISKDSCEELLTSLK